MWTVRITNVDSIDKQDKIMEKINIDRIAMIKDCKEGAYRKWSQLLIPYCINYFDNERSLRYIKSELLRLYQLDISIHTLKYIRTKYNKTNIAIARSNVSKGLNRASNVAQTNSYARIDFEDFVEKCLREWEEKQRLEKKSD